MTTKFQRRNALETLPADLYASFQRIISRIRECPQMIIERNSVNIDSKDSLGRTPLFWAAKKGHEAVVVRLLIERDDVGVSASDGWSALPHAAACGHEAVVRLLVGRDDVEINVHGKHGTTPLIGRLFWA